MHFPQLCSLPIKRLSAFHLRSCHSLHLYFQLACVHKGSLTAVDDKFARNRQWPPLRRGVWGVAVLSTVISSGFDNMTSVDGAQALVRLGPRPKLQRHTGDSWVPVGPRPMDLQLDVNQGECCIARRKDHQGWTWSMTAWGPEAEEMASVEYRHQQWSLSGDPISNSLASLESQFARESSQL